MGMVRSGSFRDREADEGEHIIFNTSSVSVSKAGVYWLLPFIYFLTVHGSVLSLASNASSSYSSVSVGSMQSQVAIV